MTKNSDRRRTHAIKRHTVPHAKRGIAPLPHVTVSLPPPSRKNHIATQSFAPKPYVTFAFKAPATARATCFFWPDSHALKET